MGVQTAVKSLWGSLEIYNMPYVWHPDILLFLSTISNIFCDGTCLLELFSSPFVEGWTNWTSARCIHIWSLVRSQTTAAHQQAQTNFSMFWRQKVHLFLLIVLWSSKPDIHLLHQSLFFYSTRMAGLTSRLAGLSFSVPIPKDLRNLYCSFSSWQSQHPWQGCFMFLELYLDGIVFLTCFLLA